MEALIAAIYLDAGLDKCRETVLALYEERLSRMTTVGRHKDSKTALQERMQARGLPLPLYEVKEITGEAHDQTFRVACTVASLQEAQVGEGRSKRLAEQDAAEKILALLEPAP